MATVDGGFGQDFRGKIGDLSFYKMKGVDKTIIRRAYGHTREKIKTDPNLDIVRRENSEFAGRSKAGRYLRGAFCVLQPLGDYNIAGTLTGLMKPVQEFDTVNEFSKRNIILSAHPHYVKGFSLNKKHPFDSVVRYPVTATIDRETLTAKVQLPDLIPNISFVPPVNHPYYALRITLGIVPDIVYEGDRYVPVHSSYPDNGVKYINTEWFPLLKGSPAMEVEVQHDFFPPDTNFTLVVAIGVFYGVLKAEGTIDQAPYVGSAKVLEVG
jgi:hypothetical protein